MQNWAKQVYMSVMIQGISFPTFLLFSEYIPESTWKYFFIFVDDLHFRGSTWKNVLNFFLTSDWSYEKKEHLVNIIYP